MLKPYLVISNFRMEGKHVPKGTQIKLDFDVARDRDVIAQLFLAGRIADASPANIKSIEAEVAAEKRRDEELALQEKQDKALRAALLQSAMKFVPA